jgi:hypothetical protein
MKTRRAPCYREVWQALSDKHQELTNTPLNPRLIVTDYEVGTKKVKMAASLSTVERL